MKRLAVFVEGQTELYFTQKLIEEISGYGNIRFDLKLIRAGAIHDLRSVGASEEVAKINIMIVDCGGEGSLKSAILERKDGLSAKGFSEIIGLLDLFPRPLDTLQKYQEGLANGMDDEKIKIKIFVAVQEIEAWFLNEHSHFLKVSTELTPRKVEEITGFNPESGCAETSVKHPAVTIKRAYNAVGSDYKKRASDTFKMLANLDFCEIYFSVREKSESLSQFIDGIESFMGVATVSSIENLTPTAQS